MPRVHLALQLVFLLMILITIDNNKKISNCFQPNYLLTCFFASKVESALLTLNPLMIKGLLDIGIWIHISYFWKSKIIYKTLGGDLFDI